MPQINWNLNPDKWSKIDTQLHQSNWKKFSFRYDSRDFISEERGLYMVTISSSQFSKNLPFSDLITPIYIGHSTNIRKRFMQHTRGNNNNLIKNLKYFSQNSMFYFIVLPNAFKSQLEYFEQTLIDVFGGSLNKSNPVSDVRREKIEATIKEGIKHAE